MPNYKLLKDLPDAKAGDEYKFIDKYVQHAYYKNGNPEESYWLKEYVENNPEWFSPVPDIKTMDDILDEYVFRPDVLLDRSKVKLLMIAWEAEIKERLVKEIEKRNHIILVQSTHAMVERSAIFHLINSFKTE